MSQSKTATASGFCRLFYHRVGTTNIRPAAPQSDRLFVNNDLTNRRLRKHRHKIVEINWHFSEDAANTLEVAELYFCSDVWFFRKCFELCRFRADRHLNFATG